MEPCEISSIQVGMPTDMVIMEFLLRQPYRWDFMGVLSLSYTEDTL